MKWLDVTTEYTCECNCKCWGDCYAPDYEQDEICGHCECHGTGIEDYWSPERERYEDENWNR